jgi:hypothetical protein
MLLLPGGLMFVDAKQLWKARPEQHDIRTHEQAKVKTTKIARGQTGLDAFAVDKVLMLEAQTTLKPSSLWFTSKNETSRDKYEMFGKLSLLKASDTERSLGKTKL